MQTWSGGSTHITMPNFLEAGLSKQTLRFFKFSKWLRPPLSLIFEIAKISLAIWVERVETHQHAKFRQNRSIGCEDIKSFQFCKMAAATILDCPIGEILMADVVWRSRPSQNQILLKLVVPLRRYCNFCNF